MGLVSEWIMPDDRGVADNRCDARFVEPSQSSKRDIDLCGSFNGLFMVEHYPQEFGAVVDGLMALPFMISWPWFCSFLFRVI